MIPDFDKNGNLPPGIHEATLREVEERFVYNAKRKKLFEGLKRSLSALKSAGCSFVLLDGSYTTTKQLPSDFDGLFDYKEVDMKKIDPLFIDLIDLNTGRPKQKQKYFGEFLPMSPDLFAYFQKDRDDNPKGIIRLKL